MAIVTLTASGRRPDEQAWERYADLDRWSEWAPQLSRVEATERRLAYGITGRVYGLFGLVSAHFVVDQVDEAARRWSWQVRRWPITVRMEHTVVERGGGSGTSLRMDGPLPVLAAYAPVAQIALYRLVTGTDVPRGALPA